MRSATRRIRSVSATEVPPNFWTMMAMERSSLGCAASVAAGETGPVSSSDRVRLFRRLVVDVALLSLAGYVVLLVIAASYWGASTEPFSVVVSAAGGGAFVAFVLVPPTYVAIGYATAVRRLKDRSDAASQEEVPTADEEVPAHP